MQDTNTKISAFSNKLDCDDSIVRAWLNCEGYPSLDCLNKVAILLNCSADYLFGLSNIKDYTKSESNETFTNRLTLLLKYHNCNWNQLAKHTNVVSATSYGWRDGRQPQTENVISIAAYFNVSIDYLIGRSDLR